MTSSVNSIGANGVGVGIKDVLTADGTASATITATDCNGASGLSGVYSLVGHHTTEGVESTWTWVKNSNVLIVHIKANTEITVTLQDGQKVYYQECRTLISMGDWSETDAPTLAFNGAVAGGINCSIHSAQVSM